MNSKDTDGTSLTEILASQGWSLLPPKYNNGNGFSPGHELRVVPAYGSVFENTSFYMTVVNTDYIGTPLLDGGSMWVNYSDLSTDSGPSTGYFSKPNCPNSENVFDCFVYIRNTAPK